MDYQDLDQMKMELEQREQIERERREEEDQRLEEIDARLTRLEKLLLSQGLTEEDLASRRPESRVSDLCNQGRVTDAIMHLDSRVDKIEKMYVALAAVITNTFAFRESDFRISRSMGSISIKVESYIEARISECRDRDIAVVFLSAGHIQNAIGEYNRIPSVYKAMLKCLDESRGDFIIPDETGNIKRSYTNRTIVYCTDNRFERTAAEIRYAILDLPPYEIKELTQDRRKQEELIRRFY